MPLSGAIQESELPINVAARLVSLTGRQRTGHVKDANRRHKVPAVGVDAVPRTGRLGFDETAEADDLGFQAGHRLARSKAIKVHVATNAFLDVLKIHDAKGAVGSPLPRFGAHEEDSDQGEKDEYDHGQLDKCHSGPPSGTAQR